MRLVVVSDTHGLHNRIESLPAGDILVHAGDFMNSGYDTEDILSFDRWLGEQSFKHIGRQLDANFWLSRRENDTLNWSNVWLT
jgi:hypothetical protein